MTSVPDLFYRYNPWWEGEYFLENIFERKSYTDLLSKRYDTKEIILLTGLRRVGKTTLMKLTINFLLKNIHVSPKNIFYISLDDYLVTGQSIIEIIEEYRKLHKLKHSEKIYVFLDEVAYKKDFEIQLKNIYDSQNVKVYASSSSASFLKSKKAFLTGRHFLVEIQPLDFSEFLQFRKIELPKSDGHLLESYFDDFLRIGGIPEYVLNEEVEYLKELIDDIINKDIASFYKVRNPHLLKDMFFLLMERAGKSVSVNKLANILNVSPDTAGRYLKMFEEVFLVYLVPRWGKPNERLLSPKKLYAADLGIRTYLTGFKDKGSLFENYVYFKLRNKGLYYILEEGNEIDFFTDDKSLVEVKYRSELSEKQNDLFKKLKAKKKIIIKNFNDVENL